MHSALELRGEISKAATIGGAARFRGNTVDVLLWVTHMTYDPSMEWVGPGALFTEKVIH